MKGAGTLGKVEVDGMGPSPSLCMCYSSQGAFFQRAVILARVGFYVASMRS